MQISIIKISAVNLDGWLAIKWLKLLFFKCPSSIFLNYGDGGTHSRDEQKWSLETLWRVSVYIQNKPREKQNEI